MTDKPKAKMTRAEAVDRLSHYTVSHKSAENMVNFFIEAGMLEIVEEKALIVNHVDKGKIIIQRNGITVYDETC